MFRPPEGIAIFSFLKNVLTKWFRLIMKPRQKSCSSLWRRTIVIPPIICTFSFTIHFHFVVLFHKSEGKSKRKNEENNVLDKGKRSRRSVREWAGCWAHAPLICFPPRVPHQCPSERRKKRPRRCAISRSASRYSPKTRKRQLANFENQFFFTTFFFT